MLLSGERREREREREVQRMQFIVEYTFDDLQGNKICYLRLILLYGCVVSKCNGFTLSLSLTRFFLSTRLFV